MVQNGKFSAAADCSVKRLNREDLPTFGRPTTPIFKLFFTRPHRDAFMSTITSAVFLGGIFLLDCCGLAASEEKKKTGFYRIAETKSANNEAVEKKGLSCFFL